MNVYTVNDAPVSHVVHFSRWFEVFCTYTCVWVRGVLYLRLLRGVLYSHTCVVRGVLYLHTQMVRGVLYSHMQMVRGVLYSHMQMVRGVLYSHMHVACLDFSTIPK